MNGPLEADEFKTHTFARSGPLNPTGFSNSGADWLDRFDRPPDRSPDIHLHNPLSRLAEPPRLGCAEQVDDPLRATLHRVVDMDLAGGPAQAVLVGRPGSAVRPAGRMSAIVTR
jgi:hypothetical protein